MTERPLVLLFVAIASMVSGQGPDDEAPAFGIAPLSEQRYEAAIACGREGPECATSPYVLCPAELMKYSARLATPFSRVAMSLVNTPKRLTHVRPMEMKTANGWGAGIYVFPAQDVHESGPIRRVFIRRGERVVEPSTATIAPAANGASEGPDRFSKGYFAFPMSAFSADEDVTVVFVDSDGEVSCTLSRRRLSTLR